MASGTTEEGVAPEAAHLLASEGVDEDGGVIPRGSRSGRGASGGALYRPIVGGGGASSSSGGCSSSRSSYVSPGVAIPATISNVLAAEGGASFSIQDYTAPPSDGFEPPKLDISAPPPYSECDDLGSHDVMVQMPTAYQLHTEGAALAGWEAVQAIVICSKCCSYIL